MAKKGEKTTGRFGIKFLNFFQQGTMTPRTKDTDALQDPWVRFGKDNLFPQYVQHLADNCAPLARAVETTALFAAGRGIRFVDAQGNEIEAAQSMFQELVGDTTEEEFLGAIMYDIALFNACAFNVRRATGADIVRIDHLDVSRLRAGKKVDGAVPAYYWSSDWAEHMAMRSRAIPEVIPAYGVGVEAKECIYSKGYKPGKDYYGEPWWLGALQAAEVWAKIDAYNRTQIDTGFAPNVHIHVPSDMDDADMMELQKDMAASYYGARGKGAFLTTGKLGVEGDKVEVTPIDVTPNAGKLDAIRSEAAGVIYDGYGIPRILVTEQESGLASQGQAYKEQVNGWLKMRVYPMRKLFTRKLTAIMNAKGIPVWDAVIEDVDYISEEMDAALLRDAYMNSVTQNEHRERVLEMDPLPDGDVVLSKVRGGAQPAMEQPNTPAQ